MRQRVFAKLLSPPCLKHWQSCFVLLVPLASGQGRGKVEGVETAL